MIDKALGLDTPEPAETYSNSPHLYAEMGIPTEATGTIGSGRKSQVKRRSTERDGAKPEQPRQRSTTRRRTRGGQPVTGHPANAASNGGVVGGDAAEETPSGSPAAPNGNARRRRRRRKPANATAPAN
jgi:hypothetical protein